MPPQTTAPEGLGRIDRLARLEPIYRAALVALDGARAAAEAKLPRPLRVNVAEYRNYTGTAALVLMQIQPSVRSAALLDAARTVVAAARLSSFVWADSPVTPRDWLRAWRCVDTIEAGQASARRAERRRLEDGQLFPSADARVALTTLERTRAEVHASRARRAHDAAMAAHQGSRAREVAQVLVDELQLLRQVGYALPCNAKEAALAGEVVGTWSSSSIAAPGLQHHGVPRAGEAWQALVDNIAWIWANTTCERPAGVSGADAMGLPSPGAPIVSGIWSQEVPSGTLLAPAPQPALRPSETMSWLAPIEGPAAARPQDIWAVAQQGPEGLRGPALPLLEGLWPSVAIPAEPLHLGTAAGGPEPICLWSGASQAPSAWGAWGVQVPAAYPPRAPRAAEPTHLPAWPFSQAISALSWVPDPRALLGAWVSEKTVVQAKQQPAMGLAAAWIAPQDPRQPSGRPRGQGPRDMSTERRRRAAAAMPYPPSRPRPGASAALGRRGATTPPPQPDVDALSWLLPGAQIA